ncbi:hypothetical protein M6B38_301080 [Iris pallida]|uniref:Uncharacterized protein n=1 Tax=Iris pallida TaxID=29817 RepID=A0AAX6HP21_IRIPA|nr:hypothetical protein M6B38_301080 [Iris pallida]
MYGARKGSSNSKKMLGSRRVTHENQGKRLGSQSDTVSKSGAAVEALLVSRRGMAVTAIPWYECLRSTE